MWQVNKTIRPTKILKQQKTHICDKDINQMQMVYAE